RWSRTAGAGRFSEIAVAVVIDNGGFALTTPPPRVHHNAMMDALFRNLTRFFAFLVFSLLAAILVSLVIGALPSLRQFGPDFLWTENWDPVREEFGALVPIVGTVGTSFIALLIAIPASFGITVFLTELS